MLRNGSVPWGFFTDEMKRAILYALGGKEMVDMQVYRMRYNHCGCQFCLDKYMYAWLKCGPSPAVAKDYFPFW